MNYPKPLMSITELREMGFGKEDLNRMVHIPGQNFARKTTGGGKWMIDTEAFERFRQNRRR